LNSMSIAHYVCFVFCVYMFSCSSFHSAFSLCLLDSLKCWFSKPNYSAATTVELHIIICTVVDVVD